MVADSEEIKKLNKEIDKLKKKLADSQAKVKILMSKVTPSYRGPEADEALLKAAIEVLMATEKISTSMLQRGLGVGYVTAARLMELLRKKQLISIKSSKGNVYRVNRSECRKYILN